MPLPNEVFGVGVLFKRDEMRVVVPEARRDGETGHIYDLGAHRAECGANVRDTPFIVGDVGDICRSASAIHYRPSHEHRVVDKVLHRTAVANTSTIPPKITRRRRLTAYPA